MLPHTIENVTGEKLTFLRISVRVGVEYLETESEDQPNAGPPMHVIISKMNLFTVLSVKVGYQELIGEKKYADQVKRCYSKRADSKNIDITIQ